MPGRYLALSGGSAARQATRAERAPRNGSLVVAIVRPGLLVLVQSGARCILLGEAGLTLGTFFTPGRPGPLQELREGARLEIGTTRGANLINAYWGGYVAFLADPVASTVDVVSAPFGVLPCFHCTSERSDEGRVGKGG